MAKEKKIKTEGKKKDKQKAAAAKQEAKTASQIEFEKANEMLRQAWIKRLRCLVESSLKNGTFVSYQTLRDLAEATGDPEDWARVRAVENGMFRTIADVDHLEEEKKAFEEEGVQEWRLMGKHAAKAPRPAHDFWHKRKAGKRVQCNS